MRELGNYSDMLNSIAAQLKQADEDIENAKLRINASERSLLVIQKAIVDWINKEANEKSR